MLADQTALVQASVSSRCCIIFSTEAMRIIAQETCKMESCVLSAQWQHLVQHLTSELLNSFHNTLGRRKEEEARTSHRIRPIVVYYFLFPCYTSSYKCTLSLSLTTLSLLRLWASQEYPVSSRTLISWSQLNNTQHWYRQLVVSNS